MAHTNEAGVPNQGRSAPMMPICWSESPRCRMKRLRKGEMQTCGAGEGGDGGGKGTGSHALLLTDPAKVGFAA